jgi:hypothetical protein
MMTWGWDSITFLAASLFVTVYVTVNIVEARHVASVILDQTLAARPYRPNLTREAGVGVEPETPVVETDGKPRHYLENDSEESANDAYSARSILARCGIELANFDTRPDVMNDDDPTDRMVIVHRFVADAMLDTDRLFTHGYEAHR